MAERLSMRDLWNLLRGNSPRLERLSFAWEKAGLVVENQPIPWCAEAVVVHADVEVSQPVGAKNDFLLHLGGQTIPPEQSRLEKGKGQVRLHFRAVPDKTTAAELFWRNRSLGQVSLPHLSADEFARRLTVQMPTVAVRLGTQVVACQTYVNTQCHGLIVSAVFAGVASLVPVLDLGLRVQIRREEGGVAESVPVQLSSSQLRGGQALGSVVLPRPRRTGVWEIAWILGERPLATRKIKAVSRPQFLRSLKLSGTRFVLQDGKGAIRIERVLEDTVGAARVGPCFLIASSEAGMAGLCKLQVRAQVKGAGQAPLPQEQEVLITDGALPFVPGTLDAADLAQVKVFELRCGRELLGTLSLSPVPSATFTQEGGFLAADNFEWSSAADEQLKEKLGKLLDG